MSIPIRSILLPMVAFAISIAIGSATTATIETVGAPPSGASYLDLGGQLPDNQLTEGDLGIATVLVADDATVTTPEGTLSGPDGVEAYLDVLRAQYPDASFAVTGFQAVGGLLVVDWRGEADGVVVHTGRTLANIRDGAITEIFFVNPNAVAPIQGTGAVTAADSPDSAIAPEGIAPSAIINAPAAEGFAMIDALASGGAVTGPAPVSFATDSEQDPD